MRGSDSFTSCRFVLLLLRLFLDALWISCQQHTREKVSTVWFNNATLVFQSVSFLRLVCEVSCIACGFFFNVRIFMCEKVRVGLRLQPTSIAGEGRPNTTLPIRNRLAVRIAGSHPADRGSIPRYGSPVMVSDSIQSA